jgi:hypothetical protein
VSQPSLLASALRRLVGEIENARAEGLRSHELQRLLIAISLGKSQQEGRAEVQITYRFGPPPASDTESEDLSMPVVKNGSRS